MLPLKNYDSLPSCNIVAILTVDFALGKVSVSDFLSVRIGSLPSPVMYAISASRLEYKDLMNLR